VSGPARRQSGEATRERRVDGERGLLLGALAALGRLTGHPLVDRLIRGRTWIAIVAFALIGIVTLQLGLLKLNAGIGRSLARSALLQRENAALSIENSELAAGNRVESAAAKLGMQIVPSGALKFLGGHDHRVDAKAAAALANPIRKSSSTSGESSAAPSSSETSSSESASHVSSEAPAGSQAATTPTSSSEAAASGGSGGEAANAASATTESSAATPSAGSAAAAAPTPQRSSESSASSAGEAGAGGGTQSGPAG
jgi:cell division protein FtsL